MNSSFESLPFWSMACGASPAPHPGVLFRGLRAPEPPGTFCSCKKYPKTRQNQGFGFLCLNWSLSDLGHLRTELGFCHLIYSGSINDTSASVHVGTSSASLILPRAAGFGRCAAPPFSSANAALVCLGAAPAGPFSSHIGLSAMQGGFQRGQAPFVSSWGRGT